MKHLTILSLLAFCFTVPALAQSGASAANGSQAVVPRLMKFNGIIPNAQGTVGVTFVLRSSQSGGTPLWPKRQNMALDTNGRLTAFLEANHAQGVPAEPFASGEARWLGVQAASAAKQPCLFFLCAAAFHHPGTFACPPGTTGQISRTGVRTGAN